MDNTAQNMEDNSLKDIFIQLSYWWSYLLSKWKIILISSIIGVILAFLMVNFKKPIYKAELSFALEDEKSGGGLGSALGLASQFGVDLGGGGGAFSGDNLFELMRSRNLMERALLTPITIDGKRQTLVEYYIQFKNLRKDWENKPALLNLHYLPDADRSTFTLKQDSLLGKIYRDIRDNDLVIDRKDKKLTIISLKVSSENEYFAKNFAEILAKEVSDFYVDTKTKKSALNIQILQHQADSVRMRLNSGISGVASAIDANPNLNPARLSLRVPSQRKQIDVQTNSVILQELVKNLEISKISLRKETPLIQIIDRPILPLEMERPSRIKAMLIGGFLFFIITVTFLILQNSFRRIIRDTKPA